MRVGPDPMWLEDRCPCKKGIWVKTDSGEEGHSKMEGEMPVKTSTSQGMPGATRS